MRGSKEQRQELGVPVMAQRVETQHFLCEDMGLIPGLTQWIKDRLLPWWWRRSQLQLQFTPWPRNFICCRYGHKKKKSLWIRWSWGPSRLLWGYPHPCPKESDLGPMTLECFPPQPSMQESQKDRATWSKSPPPTMPSVFILPSPQEQASLQTFHSRDARIPYQSLVCTFFFQTQQFWAWLCWQLS